MDGRGLNICLAVINMNIKVCDLYLCKNYVVRDCHLEK